MARACDKARSFQLAKEFLQGLRYEIDFDEVFEPDEVGFIFVTPGSSASPSKRSATAFRAPPDLKSSFCGGRFVLLSINASSRPRGNSRKSFALG